ncbi:hydrolase, partial [mine drainage metagenome]
MKSMSIIIKSTVLVGNPLGDRADREIRIFTPDNPKNDAPLLIGLPSFANDPDSFLASSPLADSFLTILSRLYNKDLLRGSNIAILDSRTKLGGNYFLNSTATGQY